jgi:hypothetical protein
MNKRDWFWVTRDKHGWGVHLYPLARPKPTTGADFWYQGEDELSCAMYACYKVFRRITSIDLEPGEVAKIRIKCEKLT